MTRLIGRIARILATGAACLVIAACYGVVMDYRIVRIRDGDDVDKPGLAGIRVTLVEDGEEVTQRVTDAQGQATIDLLWGASGELHVDDEDGEDNGGHFQSMVVDASVLEPRMVNNIDLSRADSE